jgi:hypothetical protein
MFADQNAWITGLFAQFCQVGERPRYHRSAEARAENQEQPHIVLIEGAID